MAPEVGMGPVAPDGGDGSLTSEAREEGRIGIFPNWAWVYGTVLVYGVLVILLLLVLTRILDPA
ncbi:hypothetical protein ACFL5A_01325 [Gemmatimonadota bacterium]